MTAPGPTPGVVRAPTPPRQGTYQDGRGILWVLRRRGARTLRAELVALTDGVEMELFGDDRFRRRWRFLTDSGARSFADRVRARLERRGFSERRRAGRPYSWLS